MGYVVTGDLRFDNCFLQIQITPGRGGEGGREGGRGGRDGMGDVREVGREGVI